MKYFLLICIYICSLGIQTWSQEPAWHVSLKQVQAGKSTAKDVERFFTNLTLTKQFVDKGIEARYYDSPEGELMVQLAFNNCEAGSKSALFPSRTVIEATFFPEIEMKFSRFRRTKGYKETMENDNPTTHFINRSVGLDYGVQSGRVIHVRVFAPGAADGQVRCSDIAS